MSKPHLLTFNYRVPHVTYNYRVPLLPSIVLTAAFYITLCTRHCSKCFRFVGSFNPHNKLDIIILSILQRRKLRLRVQKIPRSNNWNWDLNFGFVKPSNVTSAWPLAYWKGQRLLSQRLEDMQLSNFISSLWVSVFFLKSIW